MEEIKKINVMSLVRFALVIGLVIGLITGILSLIYAVILAKNPDIASTLGYSAPLDWQTYLASLIIIPVMYAIISFILASIAGYIYNILASSYGGIKIELKK